MRADPAPAKEAATPAEVAGEDTGAAEPKEEKKGLDKDKPTAEDVKQAAKEVL